MTTFARADTEDECQNQSLKPQGIPVAGNTITPEQNVTIPMVSDKGKVEATLELTLNKTKNGAVVNGVIKNVGNCEISTFMPVSLYPIKNGLPLGWHSLPEGLKLSNPTLKPQQFVKFFKNYSKEYVWGFNIKLGTYTLSNAEASDDCSDKSIAKQLEKIADKETSKELDACQSAEAMIRMNKASLQVIDKCSSKSKERQILKKDIQESLVNLNFKKNETCIADNKHLTNEKIANKKTSISRDCDDVYARVQNIYDQEINNNSNIKNVCDNERAMVRAMEITIKIYEDCNYQNDTENLNRRIKEGYQNIQQLCK